MAQPTAQEQFLLELINRARLDPLGEASSFGIDLNDGLDPGTISADPKQPLAFNFLLNDAANFHSQWMLDNQKFQHAGENNSRANERMIDAGYQFTGSWTWAENLGTVGTTGTLNVNNAILQVNEGLFKSFSHRENTLNPNLREVGLATLPGNFQGFNSLLVTENFAKSGSDIFLTGVAFDDLVQDDSFYSIGEGLGGIEVIATRQSDGQAFNTTTTASGGYQLALEPGQYQVSFEQNNQALGSDRQVTITNANIKLDLDTSDLHYSQHIGEIGHIAALNHGIQTIQLDHSYENPVVFALPLSYNGGDPAIARITDIQNDSFSVYVQEAEYKDGAHTDESVSYMVLEAGNWELEDGTLLEVGSLATKANVASSWKNIDFDSNFDSTPVILSQVQTQNGEQFVRTRQNAASVDGFALAMEEEEKYKRSGHAGETIGWLAMESGSGSWNGLDYQAGHTGRVVDHSWETVSFEQSFNQAPNLFASISSYKGGDPVGLRHLNLGASNVQLRVEEDQSFDHEILHTNESVDFLAIAGSGSLVATPHDIL
ncbi:MAG: carboxypeptidase regulatory-like domain-containing protein [Cyanobacteria bacterium P01_C01_bin.72]